MRKMEQKDVMMFDTLMGFLKRSVFRELSFDEASAVDPARRWAIKFREEMAIEVDTGKALASAKCVDPGPPPKKKKPRKKK